MSNEAYFEKLRWKVGLVEYDEFCKDLEQGLKSMKSVPCHHVRQQAWCYLRLSSEEAKRTFRSPFYIRNPPRAEREWGEDPEAQQRCQEWSRMLFTDAAHLCFFEGEIPTRLNIKFASKYWKLRESKTHDETLQATFGENCPAIAEADLRRLGAIRLVPAKTIRECLLERAQEFHPLQLKEHKEYKLRKLFRDTLRYMTSIDGLDYKLRFIVDNRETGGLECEIRIYPSGTKGLEGIRIGVAQPAWDIITPESIESDLNYLVQRIRIRLDAVLPPASQT